MMKFRYIALGIAAAAVVYLGACNSGTQTSQTDTNPSASPSPPVTQVEGHSGHGGQVKININSAILSELDKLEAKLGVPGLSNKIQANRPYASPGELVDKKVISQEQFDQIKDMVGIEDIVLTGVAKDVDYMTKLGLMKGHLLVAKELLDQQQPKQAEPHIGHPVEEIYADVADQLEERKVKEFKSTLSSFQDLVKSNPKDVKVKTDYAASMQAVEGAITVLPAEQRSKPEFVLQVINGLLDTANSEYTAAVANGKISAIIEYQDSRGFVIYANELYKGISTQMSVSHPSSHKAIQTAMAELSKNWPTAIAPAKIVKTPESVAKLVKSIEQDTQKVISKS